MPSTARQTLRKAEILRGRNAFQEILKNGRRADGKLLRCFYLTGIQQQPQAACVTAGFAISRKLHRAVDRNRVRRLMRESYRTNKGSLLVRLGETSQTAALVFLYLPAPGRPLLPSFRDVTEDMQSILATIAKKECS